MKFHDTDHKLIKQYVRYKCVFYIATTLFFIIDDSYKNVQVVAYHVTDDKILQSSQ